MFTCGVPSVVKRKYHKRHIKTVDIDLFTTMRLTSRSIFVCMSVSLFVCLRVCVYVCVCICGFSLFIRVRCCCYGLINGILAFASVRLWFTWSAMWNIPYSFQWDFVVEIDKWIMGFSVYFVQDQHVAAVCVPACLCVLWRWTKFGIFPSV